MRTYLIGLLAAIGILLGGGEACAHYLWLTVDDYHPAPGQEITISVGWGHKFDKDGQPRAKMVKRMKLFLIGPDGSKRTLELKSVGERGVEPVRVRLERPGTYLAVLSAKTFVCKTVDGYFLEPRDRLKGVVWSKWSETTAVALINAGASPGGGVPGLPEGCSYGIVPLENPGALRAGDMLRVRLTLGGKPSRSWVYATYAGFSDLKDTFAWATRTGKKGIARVKLLHPGTWLVKSDFHAPYPEPEKAELSYYVATLTFGVEP